MVSVNNGGNGLAVFCAAGTAAAPTFTVPTAGTGSAVVLAFGGAGPAAGAAVTQNTLGAALQAAAAILFGSGAPLVLEAWWSFGAGTPQLTIGTNVNHPATLVAFAGINGAGVSVSMLVVDFPAAGLTTMTGDSTAAVGGNVTGFEATVNALS